MRYEMRMPDLATTDSDIRIVRWMIEPGGKVERGQPLVEVETDKAAMEVESVVGGVLGEVRAGVDAVVAVGDVIAVIDVLAATAEASPTAPARPTTSAEQAVDSVPVQAVHSAPAPAPALALALALAAKGMFARNRAATEVSQPQPQPPAAGRSLSVAQRTAAKRLQASKQTVPHFYLQTSVNAAAMVARRKAAEPARLAWDAFFVLAVARAIAGFDLFRCRFDGERLTPIQSDAIGVAIDLQGELFVMPIDAPASKTVERISEEIRRGLQRLRDGDPEARRIRPALMTVTNLGVCNVESFIPIINPPEAAVLGVGRAILTPVAQDDGGLVVQHRATITLSVDHRVASGKYAGDFLGAIVKQLESI